MNINCSAVYSWQPLLPDHIALWEVDSVTYPLVWSCRGFGETC